MAYSLDVFEDAIAAAEGQGVHIQVAPVSSQPNPKITGEPPQGAVQRRKAPFIKGPLPLNWMVIAMGLSRGAAKLAVAIRYRLGLTQGKRVAGLSECSRHIVRVDRKLRTACAIKRWEVGPGIKDLERAGLVQVLKSGRGRCPVVEVLELPPTQ